MSPKLGSGPKTILLVDDDTMVVQALDKALSKQGFQVLRADTPEEAIAAAQGHVAGIDLLLVDAVMPQMSGPELADILLFLRPQMKVLFITGLDPLAIRLAFDHPCECLQKPFTVSFLLSKIHEALGSEREARSELL